MSDYDRMIDLSGRFANLEVDEIGEWFQAAITIEIENEFDGKYDPYGQPWPRNRTTPWYYDPNNNIRDSVAVGYGRYEIIVSSNHPATVYQADGTRYIGAKPFTPNEDMGLGMWGPMLDDTYEAYMNTTLGGAGKSPKRGSSRRRK